ISKIQDHPLYKEAFTAFAAGDNQRGMELMHQLQNSDIMEDVNKQKNEEVLKKSGIVMIDKDQDVPEGYCKNSFSPKTCITTQQKDLPEWKDVNAKVMYTGKSVYEDHYVMRFTTMNTLYNIKKEHPDSF